MEENTQPSAPLGTEGPSQSGDAHEGGSGTEQATEAKGNAPRPSVGRIVHYVSRNGDGIVSPAIVLRTRASTRAEVIDRWGTPEENTGPHGAAARPADLVSELPDDMTVDLLVWGLGKDYREYAVPYEDLSDAGPCTMLAGGAARTWHWPERE